MSRRALFSASLLAFAATAAVGALVLLRTGRTGARGAGGAPPASAPVEPPSVGVKGLDPAIVRAVERERAAVLASPQSAGAWGQLGMVFQANALLAEARACYARAEQLDPRGPRWPYHQGVILAGEDPSGAAAKLLRAVELAGSADHSAAADAARLRLVELLLELGRLDEAETHLRDLAGRNAASARALLNLGRLAMARGQADLARDHLLKALSGAPDLRSARVLLAAALLRLGDEAAAERERAEAARRRNSGEVRWPDPWDDEAAAFQTGVTASIQRAVRLLSSGRAAEAAEVAADATGRYPQSWQLWLVLGRARRMLRQFDDAEQALKNAARLAPHSPELPMELGTTLSAAGRHPEALAHFRRAAELQPDLGFAHLGIGRACQASGDDAAAVEAFRRAVRCQPELVDAYVGLAEALAKTGRRAEAIEHLRHAVRLNPSGRQAAELLARLEKADPS
jgi:tetratricopeptide (TPR) repeat protein